MKFSVVVVVVVMLVVSDCTTKESDCTGNVLGGTYPVTVNARKESGSLTLVLNGKNKVVPKTLEPGVVSGAKKKDLNDEDVRARDFGIEDAAGVRVCNVSITVIFCERWKLTRIYPVKTKLPCASKSSVALIGFILIGEITSDSTTALGTVSSILCISVTQVSRNPLPRFASSIIVALLSLS